MKDHHSPQKAQNMLYWHSGLFFLAVVLRIAFTLAFGGFDQQIYDSFGDQYIYLDLARNVASGQGFVVSKETWVANVGEPTSIMPPLYPLFLAAMFNTFGDNLIVVRLIQILLSSLLVNLVFVIGCYAYNQRTAKIAGVLTALYPALIMYVRPIMSEGIFFPLIALLVWLTYKINQKNPSLWFYVLWGVTAAVALLTRTEILFLIVILFVYLVFRQFWQNKQVDFKAFALVVLTTGCILMPYVLFNYSAHGRVSPLPNAKWKLWDHTWWSEMRTHPEWQGVILPEQKIVPNWNNLSEAARDEYLWNMATNFILNNPGIVTVQRAKRLIWAYPVIPRELFAVASLPDGHSYGPTSLDDVVKYVTVAEKIRVWSFRVIFFMAVAGIFITIWQRYNNAYLLILVLGWNIFHTMLFVGSERLRLQIDPYLLIFAAFFVSIAWNYLQTRNQEFS